MRAFATDRFGELSELRLQNLPKPSPGPGELLVQVRASAVNPADLKVLSGRGPAKFLHAARFPLILGYDFSGTVEALGAGVRGRAVGDEVFGFLPYSRKNRSGAFAEYLCAAQDSVGRKPGAVSHEEAAASATAACTALQGFRDQARLAAGQAVLVNGASGGVGVYAVQIAKALGARAFATASAGKADLVKDLGAERVYDYKTTPLGQIGERFEMFFDVASNSSFAAAARLLKPGGTYVTLVPSPALLASAARSLFTSKRCRFVIVQSRAADLEQLARWFDEGKLKAGVERSYPLAEVPLALQRLASGEARGKLAITVA
jgi:NADPH:quinone reductase-like Zn-dependent oxidoreductase